MPKLVIALPKNTGESSPRRNFSHVERVARGVEQRDLVPQLLVSRVRRGWPCSVGIVEAAGPERRPALTGRRARSNRSTSRRSRS